jgi:hypothetical protein
MPNNTVPQALIDSAIDQIKADVLMKDFTAIEELLRSVTEEALNAFLSETGDAS